MRSIGIAVFHSANAALPVFDCLAEDYSGDDVRVQFLLRLNNFGLLDCLRGELFAVELFRFELHVVRLLFAFRHQSGACVEFLVVDDFLFLLLAVDLVQVRDDFGLELLVLEKAYVREFGDHDHVFFFVGVSQRLPEVLHADGADRLGVFAADEDGRVVRDPAGDGLFVFAHEAQQLVVHELVFSAPRNLRVLVHGRQDFIVDAVRVPDLLLGHDDERLLVVARGSDVDALDAHLHQHLMIVLVHFF